VIATLAQGWWTDDTLGELLARMAGARRTRRAVLRMQPGAACLPWTTCVRTSRPGGVARQKWPEQLFGVDDFPRRPRGRVQKCKVREQARARIATTAA
jgi:acyl-CoA synthetase (AMP-forming)/AMP-acid ligase II